MATNAELPTPPIEWTPGMDSEFEKQSSGVTNSGPAREAALKAGGYEITPELATSGNLDMNKAQTTASKSRTRSRQGLGPAALGRADEAANSQDSWRRVPQNRVSAAEMAELKDAAKRARQMFDGDSTVQK
jgi:hypothetical protein